MNRDFTGFIGSADNFKYHFFCALAKRNESDFCSELVVISDVALWIHDIVKELLPKTTHILNLYHAKENAGKFAHAVKRSKLQKKAFADELCDLIDNAKYPSSYASSIANTRYVTDWCLFVKSIV